MEALIQRRRPLQGSTKGDFFTEECKKFMADEAAQALFKNSKKLADYV